MEKEKGEKAIGNIIVPLDSSQTSKGVIPLAGTIAEAASAPLILVHAQENASCAEDLLNQLQLRRDQIRNSVVVPLRGPLGPALSRTVSKHAHSMIVMPMSSRTIRPAEALGPVSLDVLHRAECPIVFVPPEGSWEDWKPRNILLPQNSTAECAAAIAPVVPLVTAHHGRLMVLHVPTYTDALLTREHGALPFPRYLDHPQHELIAWQEEFLGRLRDLGNVPDGIEVRLMLGMGDLIEEINNWARALPADLIVLPWYRCYDPRSTLARVLAEAECPVMTVPVRRAAVGKRIGRPARAA